MSRAGSGGSGNVSGGAAGAAGTVVSLGLAAVMRRVDTGMLGERGTTRAGRQSGERHVLGDGPGATQTGKHVLGKETRYRVQGKRTDYIHGRCACQEPRAHTHDCCSGPTLLPVPHCNLNQDCVWEHPRAPALRWLWKVMQWGRW